MKGLVTRIMLAGLIAIAGGSKSTQQPASEGPSGGDLVPIKGREVAPASSKEDHAWII